MRSIGWRLAGAASRMLRPDEREAALGDIAEEGASGSEALRDVLGLVVRRQAEAWKVWRPWLALLGLVLPLGSLLTLMSQRTADGSAIYLWLYVNNWNPMFFENASFRHDLIGVCMGFLASYLMLSCGSWAAGLALGFLSRGAIAINGALFFLISLVAELPGAPLRHIALVPVFSRGRDFDNNAAVFELTFYRVALPLIVQGVLVLLPAFWGMRHGRRMLLKETHR